MPHLDLLGDSYYTKELSLQVHEDDITVIPCLTYGLGAQRDFDLSKPRSLRKSLTEPRSDICCLASQYHNWPPKLFFFLFIIQIFWKSCDPCSYAFYSPPEKKNKSLVGNTEEGIDGSWSW